MPISSDSKFPIETEKDLPVRSKESQLRTVPVRPKQSVEEELCGQQY